MMKTTNTAARITNPMTNVCSKGHQNNGYNDGHGCWCTDCGSPVGSFASTRTLMRQFFKAGAISTLPAIFQ